MNATSPEVLIDSEPETNRELTDKNTDYLDLFKDVLLISEQNGSGTEATQRIKNSLITSIKRELELHERRKEINGTESFLESNPPVYSSEEGFSEEQARDLSIKLNELEKIKGKNA